MPSVFSFFFFFSNLMSFNFKLLCGVQILLNYFNRSPLFLCLFSIFLYQKSYVSITSSIVRWALILLRCTAYCLYILFHSLTLHSLQRSYFVVNTFFPNTKIFLILRQTCHPVNRTVRIPGLNISQPNQLQIKKKELVLLMKTNIHNVIYRLCM